MSRIDGNGITGIPLANGQCRSFVDRIIALGRKRISSNACLANVHMKIEAHDAPPSPPS